MPDSFTAVRPTTGEFVYQGSRSQQFSCVRLVEEHVRRLFLPTQKQKLLLRNDEKHDTPKSLIGNLKLNRKQNKTSEIFKALATSVWFMSA